MRLTALAQLIAIHMANGITSTRDLAAKVGYSERAITKAKLELSGVQSAPECGTPVRNPGAEHPSAEPRCGTGVLAAPECGTPVPEFLACAGATKESLRDKSSLVVSEVKGSEDTPPTPSLPAVAEPTLFGEVIAPAQALVVAKPKPILAARQSGATDLDALTAFERYNDLAQRIGLPQARSLTPARRRSLKARLGEHDGLAGWDEILANVERSSFLRGGGDRGWRADFDFLLQAKSCAKVRDGSFGNGAGHESPISRMLRRFETRGEVHA